MKDNMSVFLDTLPLGEKQKKMIHYERIINNILQQKMQYLKVNNCDPFKVNWRWDKYNNVFNAKSKKIENTDNEYEIIINVYTPARIEEYLKNKEISKNYYVQIISTILEFIIGHEIFHIVFGHCTMSEREKNQLDNSIKRKFENMCDLKSIDSMLPLLDLCIAEGINDSISGYASLLACLFIYFKTIEDDTLKTMKDILKHNQQVECEKKDGGKLEYKSVTSSDRDHPFITIRFDNICNVIYNHLLNNNYTEDIINAIYDESIEYLMNFGFKEEFNVKPYYRKNRKIQIMDLNIDFNELSKYVRKVYMK